MRDFLGEFWKRLDSSNYNMVFFLFFLICLIWILYFSVLIMLYVPTLKEVLRCNLMVGKTYGECAFHEFSYSWKNGVRLTPMHIQKSDRNKSTCPSLPSPSYTTYDYFEIE